VLIPGIGGRNADFCHGLHAQNRTFCMQYMHPPGAMASAPIRQGDALDRRALDTNDNDELTIVATVSDIQSGA
jgi:hypothetical protein